MSFEGQDIDNYGGEEDGHRKRDTSRKRDGKRDKKEKGYTMFEEEDSEGENLVTTEDIKSPSRAKKEKGKPSFKFPVRKEKIREKEEKKDKDAKKEEKEKRKEEKEGKKVKKDKKKPKHVHHDPTAAVPVASTYENPIFGVPLALAVERNKSHDGIELPAIFRECVDYIEECGLTCEGIYRISGVKSKVQALKDGYNRHQPIYLYEHEPNIVASLLKQFLRDLPEPVLTTALMPKFEEASTAKSNKKKVELFTKLAADLPTCNRLLLSWMIVHMSHVIDLATENKMTLQNVSIVLSPTMKISHRVLNVLFSNAHDLFGNVLLRKYVPPLRPAHSKWSLELPDNPSALEEELAKQESLLNQLHADLNSGLTDPVIEEQLWEVQRVVTQLKRKIKLAKKSTESGERRSKRFSNSSLPSLSAPEELHLQLRTAPDPTSPAVATATITSQSTGSKAAQSKEHVSDTVSSVKSVKFASDDNKGSETDAAVDVKTVSGNEVGKSGEEASSLSVADDKLCVKDQENRKAEKKSSQKEEKCKENEETNDKTEESATKNEEEVSQSKEIDAKHSEQTAVVVTKKEEKRQEAKSDVVELVESPVVKMSPEEGSKVKDIAAAAAADSGHALSSKPEDENVPIKKDENVPTKKDESVPKTKDENVPKKKDENVPGKSRSSSSPAPDLEKSAKYMPEKIGASVPVQKNVLKAHDTKTQVARPDGDSQAISTSAQSEPVTAAATKVKPVPPFVSLTLLEPVKAQMPKPKVHYKDSEEEKENQRKSEELRELEEELLGEKEEIEVFLKDSDEEEQEEEDADVEDNEIEDLEQLQEDVYALIMEEEELLAIEDELRQKIATEISEMERLTQEIQELQYLRQDSDLEDLTSDSNSSDESDDDDDLQDLLSQIIKDNEHLEMQNADMCQKIHEERMICLSVKLQIRLLQQKQLETSYG